MNRLILINILIAVIFATKTHSQTYLPIESQISINRDSIFDYFVPPNIPDFLNESAGDFKDMYINSLDIICCVGVDENQKLKYIFKQPLYGFNNDLSDTSFIWKYVLTSLDSVSKLWKFKPVLYKIENRYSHELKKYYTEINEKVLKGKNPRGRNRNGFQRHIIYLNIRMPYLEDNDPDFLYFLKVHN